MVEMRDTDRSDPTSGRVDGAGVSVKCTAVGINIAALATLLSASAAAAAAPCLNYPAAAARDIKPRVEAVRLVEREAADRLVGLDTRPWPYLVEQARAASVIGEPRVLQDEDGLDRCPDAVRMCGACAPRRALR